MVLSVFTECKQTTLLAEAIVTNVFYYCPDIFNFSANNIVLCMFCKCCVSHIYICTYCEMQFVVFFVLTISTS